MKGLLSPFLASLSRLVLLAYPFNRNLPFDIVRRFSEGGEGGEGRRAKGSVRRRIYLQDGALPIPDTFSPRAPATGKLSSFAKGSPPPSPFMRPSSLHQAAIDCSASERGNRQGIHPYALRASPRAFPHALHDGTRDPKCKFKRFPKRSSDLNYSWFRSSLGRDKVRIETRLNCN